MAIENKQFRDRLRDNILTGEFNDILIKKGLLPESKRDCPLVNQDIIDIIKKQTGKDKGSKQSVTDWLGNSIPKLDVIIALADACGVTVDWLLGRASAKSIEEEQGYKPFEDLGFSIEAYQALIKLDNRHRTSVDYPYIINKEMDALNLILEDCTVEDDTISFNTLKMLGDYFDLLFSPFYKYDKHFIDTMERNANNEVDNKHLIQQLRANAKLSSAEEMDTELFYNLRYALRKVKMKSLKKWIDATERGEKTLLENNDRNEESLKYSGKQWLKELYNLYLDNL